MTVIEQARLILDPKKLKLPARPRIDAIAVEDILDWEGESALRVQVVIGDDTTDDELTGRWRLDLSSAIHEALLAQGIEEFPYVFVATRSELDALGESE